MFKRYIQNGFTLVELIVVIVILAVLAAISFMMVTKWINKSSNARAASDVGTITRALHGHYGEKGIYPETSKPIGMLSATGLLLGEQGVFDEEVIKSLGTFSKLPKDPKANDYYMYTVIKNPSKGFEVGAVFENPEISVLGTKVYADGAVNAIPYVQSNYHGKYYAADGVTPIFPKPLSVFDQSSGKYLQESSIGVNGELVIDMSQLTGKQMSTFNADGIMVGGEYGDFIVPKVGYIASGATAGFSTGILMQALPVGVNSTTSTSSSSVGTLVNGSCGSSNGLTLLNTPSSNLCITGNATTVLTNTGSGLFTWSCNGLNGGTNATCSSNVEGAWCPHKFGISGLYDTSWNSSNLKYDSATSSCYVFGDENTETIAACNKWVTDNVTIGGTFVWVPARWFVTDGNGKDMKDSFYQRSVTYNGHNYVCRGFAVMKYEAKFAVDQRNLANALRKTRACSDYSTDNDTFCTTLVGGGITSSALNYPIVRIRQGEAIHACGNAGTYHLITNNEWMTISRNFEMQSNNWSTNVVGNGYMYAGHNDRGPVGTLQASTDDNDGYNSTSDTAVAGDGVFYNYTSEIGQAYKGQKRNLQLSNGKYIWDLAGNIWEFVNKSNNPLASNIRLQAGGWDNNDYGIESMCSNGTWNFFGWYGTDSYGIQECIFNIINQNKANYGPNGNLNNDNSVGSIYATNIEDRNNVFLRGGDAANGKYTGVFELYLESIYNYHDNNVGFRCAY